ncbi:hypothetical protein [Pedobacter rhizosphaerae]|uniref:Uncharacterized protein n=1 Tax=Pedobacter rhizosphaerae TaxID=390241 RepID=A0A1H9VWS7_9SPHI|nr:hypothetical protein [Pedobacter rhizosphaerae]SES26260.1 hypothetical protein SAMN04488023_15127 [Pedobacter rhizosphaerae]
MELTDDFNKPITSYESTCPLLLSAEYVQDPYLMVEAFFSFDTLAGHKRRLKEWYQYAMIESESTAEPGQYLFMHNQFVQLLQASYLIASAQLPYHSEQRRKINGRSFGSWLLIVQENHLVAGQYRRDEFEATELSLNYFNNPGQFVEDFATLANIRQLRYGLLEWLYAGLSQSNSINCLEKEYLFEQYGNMSKLRALKK